MTRGRNSRAPNRGRKCRMSSAEKDRCHDDMERLATELGVSTAPEYEEPKANGGLDFGLPEAIVTAAIFALAGLVNVAF